MISQIQNVHYHVEGTINDDISVVASLCAQSRQVDSLDT